ncbi:LysR family transcriptional regulator [Croceicoccus marinus]|uniref:LysR family transcriptional regulator n=1 Tax=Croceicoccus marinus TaxID=450378 RepID=A0A1Z1FGK3_9SPHN|nr:LysR family transcriptional regulator [Croceicoccus marinus]ARU17837.1 hypothetical protein A9D14_15945 [Croceicoccus marinus]QNE07336.1 LysR family transcriptional regulator [Croceicoccus marinus]
MRLDNFDLNLLVAFNVLMEERSVTAAARRMNITQPAMSAALKRLRESFQDELLVQNGKKMFPTPHALALAPEVEATLVRFRSLISTGTVFDPATSKRQFKLVTSDYITTVLLVPLIRTLHEEAPGIRLDLSLPSPESPELIERGEADLVISPERFMIGNHPREKIFEERLVVVGCRSNPALEGSMSVERFLGCGHVSTRIAGRDTFIEEALGKTIGERRVEVTAQSFIQVPWLLRNTNRLAVMHERLAKVCADPLSLRIADPDFDLPVMAEMMMYHSTRSKDEGLAWLRRKLIEVARSSS